MKGLYDIMSEYWVPTKIGKSTEEVEQTEVNGNKESVEVAKQHTDQQCLEDGYGFVHGSMASLLEASTDGTPQARMVEPLTDLLVRGSSQECLGGGALVEADRGVVRVPGPLSYDTYLPQAFTSKGYQFKNVAQVGRL